MTVAGAAVLLICAVAFARFFAVSAQDATPAPGPGVAVAHPVVGAWRWENDRLHPGDASFAVVHADGTYVEFYPGYGVGIGAWEATGERSASLSIVFQDLDQSPTVVVPGLLTYRLAITADDGGESLRATGTFYLQSPDGAVVEERAFDGAATRVAVAPTGPLPVPPLTAATP
jgi:hypothetical protein